MAIKTETERERRVIDKFVQIKLQQHADAYLAFWLSNKLPVSKCFSKPIKATVMEMKDFVLTLTTGYHQLSVCASIVAIKDP